VEHDQDLILQFSYTLGRRMKKRNQILNCLYARLKINHLSIKGAFTLVRTRSPRLPFTCHFAWVYWVFGTGSRSRYR